MMLITKLKDISALVFMAFILASCSQVSDPSFPVTQKEQAKLELQNVEIILLTPQNIAAYTTSARVRSYHRGLGFSAQSWKYKVGVGDVLNITIWDHLDLNTLNTGQGTPLAIDMPVRANGSIFYPNIGDIHVAGRDIIDIQQEIGSRLAEFIPDPQVSVQVAAYNSQKVVVSGEVAQPKTLPITNLPLTLVGAITASGGLGPNANGKEVRIVRKGRTYYLNIEAYLRDGSGSNNPLLKDGDVVHVPNLGKNVAYILGQVENPGTTDLGQDGLSLTDALSARGGLKEARANAKGIFVFRNIVNSDGVDIVRVFQLDASTPISLALATNFMLRPQDVVYVVTDPAAKWNNTVAAIIPSITALKTTSAIAN